MTIETKDEYKTPFSLKYGRNPVPNIFDAKAKDPTSRPYAYIAKSATNPADGFDEIGYPKITNAINRVSWWLVNEAGLAEGDAFAYMGPSDLRYVAFTIAALKTGRKILLPSLRNTNEAQQILFERTGCRLILYATEVEKSLQSLFAFIPEMGKLHVPGYDTIMEDTTIATHYPAREITDERYSDPILLLHTSGSSGNPKPIGHSPEVMLRFFAADAVPTDEGIHTSVFAYTEENYLHTLPPFHSAGCYLNLITPQFDATVVLPHPNAAMTKDYMTGLLHHNVITVLCTAPSILNDMSKMETGIKALSKLNHVSYGGGPLPEQAGKILASRLKHLWSMIGSTENGFYTTIPGDSSKWDCIKFNTKVGYRFDEVSPGLFELVIPYNPTTRKYHSSVLLFPELNEYSTKDLWMKPDGEDSQGWWRYVGRRDDLIVLSNGEKINPLPLEDTIGNHPAVKGVLVVGEYRFLPSLLVELQDGYSVTNKEEREKLVDMLWDTISQANLQAPRFSRVPKSLIYIISSTEAFNRAGKGTIQRQTTVKKFADQVDELYSSAEEGLLADGLELTDPSDVVSIQKMVKDLYSQVLDMDKLGDDDDIFEFGMDSLQVTIVVQRLKAVLRTCKVDVDYEKINPHMIYSSVSIRRLAHAMDRIINGIGGQNGVHTSTTNSIKERHARLQTIIDKYSAGLDMTPPAKKVLQQDKLTVILTGSTGSLGSYLLHFLLLNPRVAKVVCLNRSADAEARQTAGNKSKDLSTLWTTPDSPKQVEFFTADMSKADLGLGESVYSRLLSETNAIVHSAWKVDFNHRIESFEKGHIAGTRHLIDFSNKCFHKAPIVFVSSISTVLNWVNENPGQLVPETMIHNLSAPEFMGYGESKYVGERLIESFTKFSGTPSAVLRVGQIAGPVLSTAGSWNAHEWFPSLLASSKYLGLLPDSLGAMRTISWVPVDILAKVILQLLDVTCGHASETEHSSLKEPAVYNLVNPQISAWSELITTVQKGLGEPSNIQIVPFGDWVEALAKSTNDNHGFVAETNPATKLLDFFRLISRDSQQLESQKVNEQLEYEVKRLKKDSSEAAQLGPVSPEWMKIWLKKWAF